MASRPHILLAGLTTRALAASAARAGFRVTAVDAFGDLDLRACASVIALTRDGGGFTPAGAALAADGIAVEAVAYTSNFENAPEAVTELARGRELLGNPPHVLRRVRRPITLMRVLARRGFAVPRTRATAPATRRGEWLMKPRRSGGGHGVARWRGQRVSRAQYLQERIGGLPGSIIFLADGCRAVPLGLTRQLVGDPTFGSRGFSYCGSLLGSPAARLFPGEARLRATAEALATAVTEEYGLVGLNGIDFIARDGVPYPTEVNPRACASMELIERSGGPSLFGLHLSGCRGVLQRGPVTDVRTGVVGKAVMFARREVTAVDLRGRADRLADLPHPGERIGRGHPICTVFAAGRDADECRRSLAARAREIYGTLESRARGAA
jgi:uncharacterized protein